MRARTIVMVAFLIPPALWGQSPDERADRTTRRLSIALEWGGSVGGPGAGLVTQLREAGFDDRTPESCFFIFCTPATDHPTEEGSGIGVGITARYAIGPRLAVGAGYGDRPLGGATGYRDAAGTNSPFGDRVVSHWSAKAVWAAAFWRPYPTVRIGGGPNWHRLTTGEQGSSVSRAGLMGEVGLDAPAGRRLFVDLAIRGHLVPPTDVEHSGTVPITLRPDWSHVLFLIGLGVRL